MKNYTTRLIIGVFSSLLLFSCGGEGETEYTSYHIYKYKNKSDYEVSITKWLKNKEDKFVLNPNDNLEFEIELNGGGCSVSKSEECPIYDSDSLRVDFEDGKSLFLIPLDTSEVSLFHINNYKQSKIDNKVVYTYEFTEKDYQAAD